MLRLWLQQSADLMLNGWYYAPQGALLDIILYNMAVRWLVHRARRANVHT